MAYSKSSYAKSLGISNSELEKRAKSAGFSTTEEYANSKGGGGGNDALSMALSYAKAMGQLNEPVAKSMEAQATPLSKRYDDLIASIKGNQVVAENRQTLTTNNELAKRGILSQSGLAQQTMTDAVNPVTQQYTGQITDVGNQKNTDLSNLATQVAQIRAGGNNTAFTSGIGQYNTQQNLAATTAQNSTTNALNAQNSAVDNAYKQALTQKTLATNLGGGVSNGVWS